MYIEKLDNIVNKYNNTHGTIKMKPADVKSSTYIDFDKKRNEEDPIKVGDHKRISKYKNIFEKVTFRIVLKKFILYHGLMSLVIKRKLIERKGDELYAKWKGCDNSCHSWIDEKDFII